MPIEIKEVLIRAVVNQENEGVEKNNSEPGQLNTNDAIVQSCVKQVLKILKQSRDR